MSWENKIHIIQKDHWGEAFNLTLLIAAFVTNGLVKLPEDAIIFNTEIKSNRPCAVVKAFKFLEICLIQVHKDACASWMRRCQSFAGFWIDVEKKKLRRFSPNCGTIPQFTGFVPKDWIVEKVAQKAAHPGARYMFELTYHHSLGNFFQLAIRNSVMQPCAAFHSLWRLCFTGDSSPEQVVYTCCLGRNTHTHTHIHNFRNGVHTATLIFILM